mgnify:FL=1
MGKERTHHDAYLHWILYLDVDIKNSNYWKRYELLEKVKACQMSKHLGQGALNFELEIIWMEGGQQGLEVWYTFIRGKTWNFEIPKSHLFLKGGVCFSA